MRAAGAYGKFGTIRTVATETTRTSYMPSEWSESSMTGRRRTVQYEDRDGESLDSDESFENVFVPSFFPPPPWPSPEASRNARAHSGDQAAATTQVVPVSDSPGPGLKLNEQSSRGAHRPCQARRSLRTPPTSSSSLSLSQARAAPCCSWCRSPITHPTRCRPTSIITRSPGKTPP
jgi:hypothetical protein